MTKCDTGKIGICKNNFTSTSMVFILQFFGSVIAIVLIAMILAFTVKTKDYLANNANKEQLFKEILNNTIKRWGE